MRAWRTRRIGLREADELVTGRPSGLEHTVLKTLLAAAAAPALPEELADEQVTVAKFVQARRDAVPTATQPGSRHVRMPLSIATIAVKVVAGTVVLVAGGTAFAAATGSLPAGMQQHAHDLFSRLGVPAPNASARPDRAATHGPSSPGTPSPGAGVSTGTPDPSRPDAVGLCRAWDAARNNPHGRAMPTELWRALTAAAGDEAGIPAFCAKALAGHRVDPSPATTPTPPPGAATPSHGQAGSGNNSGTGNEGGTGNGNGNDGGHGYPTSAADPHH
jgi:hypothetical protein